MHKHDNNKLANLYENMAQPEADFVSPYKRYLNYVDSTEHISDDIFDAFEKVGITSEELTGSAVMNQLVQIVQGYASRAVHNYVNEHELSAFNKRVYNK